MTDLVKIVSRHVHCIWKSVIFRSIYMFQIYSSDRHQDNLKFSEKYTPDDAVLVTWTEKKAFRRPFFHPLRVLFREQRMILKVRKPENIDSITHNLRKNEEKFQNLYSDTTRTFSREVFLLCRSESWFSATTSSWWGRSIGYFHQLKSQHP